MICYAILLLHATRKRKVVCRKGWNLCSFLTKLLLLVGIDKSLQSGFSRMVGWNVAASYSTIGKLYLMKHSTVYWRYPKLIFLWKIWLNKLFVLQTFHQIWIVVNITFYDQNYCQSVEILNKHINVPMLTTVPSLSRRGVGDSTVSQFPRWSRGKAGAPRQYIKAFLTIPRLPFQDKEINNS